ncbi:hypothetical protein PSTG_14822 [Puccinia striiformis f. sp. tritici PST-78]|uniref:Uncharacterized protein n=1 Tax=Puccinia striiformis f. sp. tritici PST-78 TaxID=1165861 RepID=A0A0L0UXI0_9BASI|nr:hypothetical protein PSTG_14822 [Puccinia striiformis f. sp. tritici PST-78]
MATSDNPPQENRSPPKPLKRHKLFGCGDTLVENKLTKMNFVNHIACKHPGEWKLALEASENSEEGVETLQSSGTPATSQSHLMPMHKIRGPLQQIMLKTRQSNFDTNLINES